MTGAQATHPRADHPEILDDPAIDPRVVRRSMRDVALSNRLFGGKRAVVRELSGFLHELPARATLLDVGTGLGDIPYAAARTAATRHCALFTIGLDASELLARESRSRVAAPVVADAGSLPFRDRSIQLVTCSQVLHHFAGDSALAIIREMDRVSSGRVVIADIRRSRLAMAGLWLASFFLRFHPVSRHDGIASIRRGFTADELCAIVHRATGRRARVRTHAGFRLTASWDTR